MFISDGNLRRPFCDLQSATEDIFLVKKFSVNFLGGKILEVPFVV